MSAKPRRNLDVERTVNLALERIDYFLAGGELQLPSPRSRHACDRLLENQSPSVFTGCLFLTFYRLIDKSYDFTRQPVGSRGKFGDKRLCEELSKRNLTLHGNIKAPFENIGSKGDVGKFSFIEDSRYKEFLSEIATLPTEEIGLVADYLAEKFAASQKLIEPLPPVGADVLTFARAKLLFHQLIALPTEGFVQQFLITALLAEFRRKEGVEVTTHHPHAPDTFDNTAGDIEEKLRGKLLRAYEVTVRDDWKSRVSGFKAKMDKYGLAKYTIIASNVRGDAKWYSPAHLISSLESYGRDIAVLDIEEVLNFMAAELTPAELRNAINQVYKYLADPNLSGRHDLMDKYRAAVSDWLDIVDDIREE
jgi:hypothetical protein